MLEPAAARDLAASLVALARRNGADAADAVYVGDRSQSVSVRLGQLEDVHRAEGEEIGFRVFIGKRNATVASSDLSKDAMQTLVERALAMAAEAPEDQYAGLAPEELLFRGVLTPLVSPAVHATAFGLWHVRPAMIAGDSVVGTVAVTGLAALGFDWLRRRSGSVLAPALAHLAINTGGAAAARLMGTRRRLRVS